MVVTPFAATMQKYIQGDTAAKQNVMKPI